MTAFDARTNDVAALQADIITLQMALADTEALEMQHGAVIERLRAELTELRLQCIAADGQAGEHHAARIAAEAERDRLRDALEDALAGQPQDDSCEAWATHARAALTPNTGA
jgi:hypothetical protein